MPRGGKRPGAGAPKGNLNALRHGRFSPRLKDYALNLITVPEFAELLLFVMSHKGRRRTGIRPLSPASNAAVARILAYIARSGLTTHDFPPLIEHPLLRPSIKGSPAAYLRSLLAPMQAPGTTKHNRSARQEPPDALSARSS